MNLFQLSQRLGQARWGQPPIKHQTHPRRIAGAAAALAVLALGGCADLSPHRAMRVASAAASQTLCVAAFVSGLDPARAYADEMQPSPGMGWVNWGMHYEVDQERHEVRANIAGRVQERSVYREGLGCAVAQGPLPDGRWLQPAPAADGVDPFPGLAVAAPAPAADARWQAAVDAMFVEDGRSPQRRTQAVLVVQRGRILAERYAPDVTPNTPLPGHSISKSVTHALVGVLVRQGRLNPDAPAPVPAWQEPGDPRRAITPRQLLANASGLPWDETSGGWDAATRMWFTEPDPYAFATTLRPVAAPGQQFNYSNAGWTVLSRLLRDASGGSAERPEAFPEMAWRELLAPLGMQHTVLSLDATGTPLGANQFAASARDWARFGLLYLNDGVVAGQHLLPEGWVAQARTPTLDAGYGQGFWLNHTDAPHPLPLRWGLPGAPAEAFFARGYLGQFIVIVPSLDLVVVRLGISYRDRGDVSAVGQLVGQAVKLLAERP